MCIGIVLLAFLSASERGRAAAGEVELLRSAVPGSVGSIAVLALLGLRVLVPVLQVFYLANDRVHRGRVGRASGGGGVLRRWRGGSFPIV